MENNLGLDQIELVGDLKLGRPTFGDMVSVSVYRLVLYSLKAVLTAQLGKKKASWLVHQAGKMAGKTVYDNFLNHCASEAELFRTMQELFLKAKISRFEAKKIDLRRKEFLFTISEDLDCSGIPADGETKCDFDEGLISGILSEFYKCGFNTKEIGCWGTGEKGCFFKSEPLKGNLPS